MHVVMEDQEAQPNTVRRRSRGQPPRVLVVEDDRELAELVRLHLTIGGYAVEVSTTVDEARGRLRGEREPDLIITDVRVVGESGVNLLFSEKSGAAHPPVLMMSALVSDEVRHIIEDAGAAVLETPFSFGRLHASVIRMLMRSFCADEPPASGEEAR